jgi:DNA-binding response OmpR family regulator
MKHSDELTYDFLDDADEDTLPRQRAVEKMRGHVLIAEDDGPLRDMLATILRLEGHHVTTVPSADAMLRAVGDRTDADAPPFDVVLTDVRMPGSSGLDVVEMLRSDGHRIPIIVMTAFPDEGIRSRAHSLDTLLIAKPFSLETICFAIQSLVRQCAL